MISRRNIRIKVVHTIFECQLGGDDQSQIEKNLERKFEKTVSLHAAIWQLVSQVCQYVIIHANTRASKHLPTPDDLNVNTKIADNAIIRQLNNNPNFIATVKKYGLATFYDEDVIRGVFLSWSQTPEYKEYIRYPERQVKDEKEIILHLLEHGIYGNENTLSVLSEKYINLDNDLEMICLWTDKVLMNLGSFRFESLVSKEKHQFAFDLLRCYYDKKETLLQWIEPKLQNWDPERVAILDMIILHLGVCEMLYFESVPLKVTINEYIDIAKSYAGMQSGQFVNGLLDNVRKALQEQNLIHKVDYKSIKN